MTVAVHKPGLRRQRLLGYLDCALCHIEITVACRPRRELCWVCEPSIRNLTSGHGRSDEPVIPISRTLSDIQPRIESIRGLFGVGNLGDERGWRATGRLRTLSEVFTVGDLERLLYNAFSMFS